MDSLPPHQLMTSTPKMALATSQDGSKWTFNQRHHPEPGCIRPWFQFHQDHDDWSYPLLRCSQAWVNFNGNSTITIRDSFNVKVPLLTKSKSKYTVNFTNAMSNKLI